MIPIKSKEELLDHCNKNLCTICFLESFCDDFREKYLENMGQPHAAHAHIEKVFEAILIHNRKEKLEKLLEK